MTDKTAIHLKLLRDTMKENLREEGKGLINTAQFKTSFHHSPFTCQQQQAYYQTMQDKGLIIVTLSEKSQPKTHLIQTRNASIGYMLQIKVLQFPQIWPNAH